MLSLGMGNKAPAEGPWAADNGRYGPRRDSYTDDRYLAFLTRHAWAADRCLFATAPDVVGDSEATGHMSAPMYERIRELGYPVALVAQDGLIPSAVPWDDIDALFIGGTTAWKTSQDAHDLVTAANAHGKWAHMGRVNSYRRLRIASDFGCQSVDGTRIAFAPDKTEPLVREWLAQLHRQPGLWA